MPGRSGGGSEPDEHRVRRAVPRLRPHDGRRGGGQSAVSDLPADLPRCGWVTCSRRVSRRRAPRPTETRASGDRGVVVRIAQVAPLVRGRPAGRVRRHGAGDRHALRRSGGSGARRDAVRAGDFGDGTRRWRHSTSRCASGSAATSWSTSLRTCTCRCWPSSTSAPTTSTSSTPTSTSGRCPSPV